ncbi:MAG: hypothetical protein ACLQDY_12840 [Streptosporangiaceae bacterium]
MATLRNEPPDFPGLEKLREYNRAIHGPGDNGIREWKRECMEWLRANPGRVLPAGDILGVLRETVSLISIDAGAPGMPS